MTMKSGRNKLLINHLGRLFVTSDAATIIREIEVVHPAAKLLVMASQAQESEVSNLNIILSAGERRSSLFLRWVIQQIWFSYWQANFLKRLSTFSSWVFIQVK